MSLNNVRASLHLLPELNMAVTVLQFTTAFLSVISEILIWTDLVRFTKVCNQNLIKFAAKYVQQARKLQAMLEGCKPKLRLTDRITHRSKV